MSAITNGSRIDAELISLIAENLDCIGFSVDSTNHKTNLIIGRSEKNKVMDTDKVRNDIHALRKLNPEIDIKINTVVNSNNFNEDLSSFISDVNPSKWKIFKVLPSQGYTSTITDAKFRVFLDKHSDFESIIASEDNNEMMDSYIMVDPLGRFFQNSNLTDGYVYSHPIIEVGVEKALSQINFSFDKFLGRYSINEKLIDTIASSI
jgi:radical S-adenosyl methionine domain-containing protein 2